MFEKDFEEAKTYRDRYRIYSAILEKVIQASASLSLRNPSVSTAAESYSQKFNAVVKISHIRSRRRTKVLLAKFGFKSDDISINKTEQNHRNQDANTIPTRAALVNTGSSGAMEPWVFERSIEMRKLQYVNFFGDGDSKGYAAVKDIYGNRGKLTDAFIDKLQNYYSIAICDNVNDLQGMQCAVFAAFSHCFSNAKQQMHGQCPVGLDS
ncbi:uncharacterized protein TNCV_4311951 [Trichonephila clavipes]|nr:uncharacterized protein TNCV_4311951 [Trichonephila clavipes]